MKIGREVEGRFKGLLTLFMSAQEAKAFFHRKSLKESCLNAKGRDLIEKVRHIYISDHENVIRYDDECLKVWGSLGFVVCLERTALGDVIRESWPTHVSFMLVVKHDDIWEMYGDDQIKFSEGQKVLTMTKHQMTKTVPDDFLDDIELELKD